MGFAKRLAKLCLRCDNVLTVSEDYDLDDGGDDNSVLEIFTPRDTMNRVQSPLSRRSSRSNLGRPRSFSRRRSKSKGRPLRSPQRRAQRKKEDFEGQDAFFYDIIDAGSADVGSSLSGSFDTKPKHQDSIKKGSTGREASTEIFNGSHQRPSEANGAKQADTTQNESNTARHDSEYHRNIGSLIASTIDEKLAAMANIGSMLSFEATNDEHPNASSIANGGFFVETKKTAELQPILKSPTSPKSVTFDEQDEEIVPMEQPSKYSFPSSPMRHGTPSTVTSPRSPMRQGTSSTATSYSQRSSETSPSLRKVRSNSSALASPRSSVSIEEEFSRKAFSRKATSNASPRNSSGRASPFQRGRSSPVPKGLFRGREEGRQSSPVTIVNPSPKSAVTNNPKSRNAIPKDSRKMANRQVMQPKGTTNTKQRSASARMQPNIHVTLHMK